MAAPPITVAAGGVTSIPLEIVVAETGSLRGNQLMPQYRAYRQTAGRLRNQHPRPADLIALMDALTTNVRRHRPQHRIRDQLRDGCGSPGPGGARTPRRDSRAPIADCRTAPLVPSPLNNRLWHIPFNRVEKVPEQLVAGREDIFFGYKFAIQGRKLPDEVIQYYVGLVSRPDALPGSFAFHRAFDSTLAQNEQRKTRWLTMPVVAIGGEAS